MSPQTQATLESLTNAVSSLEAKLDNEILTRDGRMNGIDVALKTLGEQIAALRTLLEQQKASSAD